MRGIMPNKNFVDITGRVFGRLTAVRLLNKPKNHWYWLFQCACGNSIKARGSHVTAGRTSSCGCFRKECRMTHGHSRSRSRPSPTYSSWASMIGRCCNPNSAVFHYYGGRGITVCERWKKFENFLADMGERPSPDLSLDRIDNNGNYEPGNCRWATWDVQCANKRSLILDLTGSTFGKLVPMKLFRKTGSNQAHWLCKCACGTEKVVLGSMLRSLRTRSCGCAKNRNTWPSSNAL